MTEQLHPWERRDDETDKAWLGFKCYRDLEKPRTIDKAWSKYSEEVGLESDKRHNTFEEWHRNNDWQKRATAFDRWHDRQTQHKIKAAQAAVRKRIADGADEIAERLLRLAIGKGEGNSSDAAFIRTALKTLGISDKVDIDVDAEHTHTKVEELAEEHLEDKSPAELEAEFSRAIEDSEEAGE